MPYQKRDQSFVIIGGNAAGLSAASKIKRLRPEAHVLVFEASPDVSYSNCGIPYWLEGLVAGREALVQLSPRQLLEKRGIEAYTAHEVTAILPERRTITVRPSMTGKAIDVPYDRLLLATGAKPVRPEWPLSHAKNVFTIRSLQDGAGLAEALTSAVRSVAVIGGNYLGLEMAAAFRSRGLDVVVIEKSPNLLPAFAPEIQRQMQTVLAAHEVAVYTAAHATSFEGSPERATAVSLQGEPSRVAADLFVLAAGVEPNVSLAAEAGIALGQTGAIHVDRHMRTNIPEIYAAGDCVEIPHQLTEKYVWLPLGPAANKQGRIAGENMAGRHARYWGALGTLVFKVFDLEIGRTGLTETDTRDHSPALTRTTVSAPDIAGYLPGNKTAHISLLHDRRCGRILGAEVSGYHGMGKRLDVLVAAITAKMTVSDLAKLDLAYTPAVAPVWDPLLIAANVALRK